ncbi:MAG: universal stress protein [Dehalococcoidia bacterium]
MTDAQAVLVPLDGSPVAEAALPYAEAIAKATEAPIQLLTVFSEEPAELLSRRNIGSDTLKLIRDGLATYLASTAETLRGHGLTVTPSVVAGRAVEAILAEGERDDVALIVMATHGAGGVERLLVGSVADKVMRLSTRPTLLVPPRETATVEPSAVLRRLLVPLDGSSLSKAALPEAMKLAVAAKAHLILLQVVPLQYSRQIPPLYLPEMAQWDTEAVSEAQAELEGIRGGLPTPDLVETVVVRGSPSPSLTAFVKREAIDLVVMSTHGHGGFRRFVLGSTADWLIRAGIPTLLVRPPAEA